MGKPKLLLPFNDKTIIESVLKNVEVSKVDKILVVLGANREKIEKKIKNFPIKITVNPDYSKGMHSSVQCGFRSLPENTRAVLVILGDQPSVCSTTINILILEFQKGRKGIIIPVYKKRRGHPILIDIKYKNEIYNLDPNIGLRELIHNHPEDIQEVKIKTSSILQDIDNPDDYLRELKSKKGNKKK